MCICACMDDVILQFCTPLRKCIEGCQAEKTNMKGQTSIDFIVQKQRNRGSGVLIEAWLFFVRRINSN